MRVKWKLQEFLRNERGVTGAAEVSRLLLLRAGYKFSTQAVCHLFNDEPKMIRLKTIKALCDAFYCRLSDFFEVLPAAGSKPQPEKARGVDPSNLPSTNTSFDTGPSPKKQKKRDSTGPIDFAAFFPDARNFSSRKGRRD